MKIDYVDIALVVLFVLLAIGSMIRLALLARIGSAIYDVKNELVKSNKRVKESLESLPKYSNYTENFFTDEKIDDNKWY